MVLHKTTASSYSLTHLCHQENMEDERHSYTDTPKGRIDLKDPTIGMYLLTRSI